jgi:hypothetical protein
MSGPPGSVYKQRWKTKDGGIRESTIWWIKYYREGGQFRESSQTDDRSKAEALLRRRVAGELPPKKKRGQGSVYLRNGSTWWIRYYKNGRAFRESSGSEKRNEAEELLRTRLAAVAPIAVATPRGSELLLRLLNALKNECKSARILKRSHAHEIFDDDIVFKGEIRWE